MMLYAKVEESYMYGPTYTVDEGYVTDLEDLKKFLDGAGFEIDEEELEFVPNIIEQHTGADYDEPQMERLELITPSARVNRLKRLYCSIGDELDEAIKML